MRRSSGRWICCLLPRHPLMAKLVRRPRTIWHGSRPGIRWSGSWKLQLLNLDEASGLWPKYLPPKSNRATDNDMYFVDELSCVGCTWCADVARSTFRMMTDDNSYGQARVVQQGGDSEEVVQEAIACCPADCIHTCTRDELELLEEYRSLGYTDDLLARFQTRRLMGEGEGGGSFAAPHWRDPIVHQSWRKGRKIHQVSSSQARRPAFASFGRKIKHEPNRHG